MKFKAAFYCGLQYLIATLLLLSVSTTAQSKNTDSLRLAALVDSMGHHSNRDTNCTFCDLALNNFTKPHIIKKYPTLVSTAFQRANNCLLDKYGLAATLPLLDRMGKLAKQNNSIELQAWYLNLKGIMLFEANQNDSVLPVLLQSLQLFEKIKTSKDGLSRTCEFIGGVYWKIADTTKAIYYRKKALEYAEGIWWLKDIMLTDLAVQYTRIKQHDSARYYILESMEQSRKYNRGLGIAYITLLKNDYALHADDATLELDFQNGVNESKKVNGVRLIFWGANDLCEQFFKSKEEEFDICYTS